MRHKVINLCVWMVLICQVCSEDGDFIMKDEDDEDLK